MARRGTDLERDFQLPKCTETVEHESVLPGKVKHCFNNGLSHSVTLVDGSRWLLGSDGSIYSMGGFPAAEFGSDLESEPE